jgi:hypothetical protein
VTAVLRPLAWPLACASLTGVAAAAVLNGGVPSVRAAVVLPFLLVCPGVAVARLLRLRDRVAELVLGLALSAAIDGGVPGILLYAHAWNVRLAFAIICAVTLVASVTDAVVSTGAQR